MIVTLIPKELSYLFHFRMETPESLIFPTHLYIYIGPIYILLDLYIGLYVASFVNKTFDRSLQETIPLIDQKSFTTIGSLSEL